MAMIEEERAVAVPEQGNLVRVRGRWWMVEQVRRSSLAPDPMSAAGSAQHHEVRLVPVDDLGSAEPLIVFWEVEPGTEVRPQAALPDPTAGLDDVATYAAFLDAVRWGAVASADPTAFQAPFRAGIDIEDYQLLPLVEALRMPRVALLIADDVGLGKTVEAGLIAQELALRGQAQRMLIVCPPSLSRKWQREMREKFGLRFEVVDTDYVRQLRRDRGVGVNPFQSHPRLIVSLQWVKFEPQMRRFDELLPPDPNVYPRAFDLLIVDEAHQVAPAAPARGGRYPQESLQTRALRRLAPHFEHRLFLTATPHNGYRSSFEALLELLDPNRFTKGVPPTDKERDAVMVRRLKSDLRTMLPDGEQRFAQRRVRAIEVEFPERERELFGLLDDYTQLRRSLASTPIERAAARFITLLLKKRLLSSPAAFKHTLDTHIQTLNVARDRVRHAVSGAPEGPSVTVQALTAAELALDDEAGDDAAVTGEEAEALALAAAGLPEVDPAIENRLVAELRMRSLPGRGPRGTSGDGAGLADDVLAEASRQVDERWRRPDAKAQHLLDWLAATCYPGGEWNDERVIVFTEYLSTLNYLDDILSTPADGRPSPIGRVATFHGNLPADDRERIIREFNYDPARTKVRVLLATDAAAEGIDLHLACHRLVHYEVPFNPNRMEQRNGRVDRHGQRSPHVDLYHFASARPDDDDGLGYDHSFLLRVAEKLNDIRSDLGQASPVLADRIEARMLGEADLDDLDRVDAMVAGRRDQARADLERVRRQFAADLERVRAQYRASVEELELSPATVERAVQVALRLHGQPALVPTRVERAEGSVPAFVVGDLGGTWGEALAGLYDEVAEVRLPVTFDVKVASGHTDVGYLHVGHPLVARCLRALRAEVWGGSVYGSVNRVTVRYADVDEPVAVAHARVVVSGADGTTLDEVIEPAAVRVGGRQGRLNVGEVQAAVAAAGDEAPAEHVRQRYVGQWDRVRPALEEALRVRADEVRDQRSRRMDAKRDAEERRLRGTLAELKASIVRQLDELDRPDQVEQLQLWDWRPEERRQWEADRRALRERAERIDSDVEREVDVLHRRYAVRDVNWFPVAAELLVPEGER